MTGIVSVGGREVPARVSAGSRSRRRRLTLVLALAVATASCQRPATSRESPADPPAGEWRAYGGTYASARYSPLDQIDRTNVGLLRVAWRWRSPDHDVMAQNPRVETFANQATPLMVGGVLYVSTSLSQVAAIDAATGQTLWVHDPEVWRLGTPPNHGWVHRGVAYWTDGVEARIFIGTGNAFLVALDARTGKPIPGFGDGGRIDLTAGLGRPVDRRWYSVTSPPVVVRDVVIVGASIFDYPIQLDMPPGHVRGFDARTGTVRWIFHAIPQAGEPGNERWEQESWKSTGGVNVWAPMSADEDLGYVYLPFSTPANDYYGGNRPGDNLYAESLVCLDAATGRRVWHYQIVRHGVWDYDLPAAPNLADLVVNGRRVRAVAQVTKQGFVFVFDRVNGRPLWPIEDRPVPQSKVPGEKTAATQPFPTRPAPVDRQGVRSEEVIDFTPELRREALAILERYDWGPLYTPPSERGTIFLPGPAGGPSWSGAALDPSTGRLYVTSRTLPFVTQLNSPGLPVPAGARYAADPSPLFGPDRLPLFQPPFGRIVAIDLNTGEHAWTVPLGEGPRRHRRLAALDLPRLGSERRGFPLVTRTLLFAAQEGRVVNVRWSYDRPWVRIFTFANTEPALEVFDKATGALLARIELPANAQGALMTYMMRGRQYIVFPVGGANLPAELIALSLP
jgi:quinoprotein glucose dehydrogenase